MQQRWRDAPRVKRTEVVVEVRAEMSVISSMIHLSRKVSKKMRILLSN